MEKEEEQARASKRSAAYTTDQLGSLIDGIYDAAVEPTRWPVFLSHLSGVLGGSMPSLFLHDPRTAAGSLTINVGWDARMVRSYSEYFSERNIWLRSRPELLKPGIVRTSHMMCSRKAFLASEWHADYCRPMGVSQGIGATILEDAGVTSNIVVMADERRDDYGPEDIALVRVLLPHLQRALRTHSVLSEREARRCELQEALEQLATGVVLVSHDARVIFINAAARHLVNRRDGLAIDRTGIVAIDSGESGTLRALIAQAAQTSQGQGLHAGGTLRVSRRHGRKPLELTVSPISVGDVSLKAPRAVAVIYISDPEHIVATAGQAFARLHGLTRAEERVVITILRSGGNIRSLADELAISPNTLKTQLKSMYAKTGARGQADLIRLALRGAEPVTPLKGRTHD
jgi:DNA-binding CsgD family transcriptional regulator/PAS domain-containing protein